MGATFFLFFGTEDTVLIDEIAKVHKLPKEVVEKHYKEMLKEINDELQSKIKD